MFQELDTHFFLKFQELSQLFFQTYLEIIIFCWENDLNGN